MKTHPILYVEDSDEDYVQLSALCEASGIEIDRASSLKEAMFKLNSNYYSVVLIDALPVDTREQGLEDLLLSRSIPSAYYPDPCNMQKVLKGKCRLPIWRGPRSGMSFLTRIQDLITNTIPRRRR